MFDLAFNAIFKHAFDAMAAVNQVAALLGGLLCLALGLALFFNKVWWRMKAQRLTGEIVGVRLRKNCFHPVYRYMLPATGGAFEATSSAGDSGLRGKETGRRVELLVFPDRPEEAEAAGGYVQEIVGLFLAAPGAFLVYLAFTAWPVTFMTWLAGFGFTGVAAAKFSKYVIPREQRGTRDEWRARKRAEKRAERAALPVRRIEDYLASPEGARRLEDERKANKIGAPVVLCFGLALLYAAHVHGGGMLALEKEGLRARGEVVSLYRGSGSGGDAVYYPVVSFRDGAGRAHEFRGRAGSNPPPYRAGEEVGVLYLAAKPGKSAVIDSGVWRWIFPGLLAAGGVLLLLLSLSLFRRLWGAGPAG